MPTEDSPGATCPRCDAPLPPGAYWEELKAAPGRLPAYRVRHKTGEGKVCVGYAGPECGAHEEGAGDTSPAPVARSPHTS